MLAASRGMRTPVSTAAGRWCLQPTSSLARGLAALSLDPSVAPSRAHLMMGCVPHAGLFAPCPEVPSCRAWAPQLSPAVSQPRYPGRALQADAMDCIRTALAEGVTRLGQGDSRLTATL